MSNSLVYKENTFKIGDTVSLIYTFKESGKERSQEFKGTLLRVKGSTPATKMITVRKISHIGIGVERIIPLASPFLTSIKLVKKANIKKAKAYFVRGLSDYNMKRKLFKVKA